MEKAIQWAVAALCVIGLFALLWVCVGQQATALAGLVGFLLGGVVTRIDAALERNPGHERND